MLWSDVEGCLKEIEDLTGCSSEIAEKIFLLVADWTGGNIPDKPREEEEL